MNNKKKPFLLKRFFPYMGQKKFLLPLSLFLSALSSVLNLMPFVFVWYVVRSLLSTAQTISLDQVSSYAWMGFASAIAALLLYFLALVSSHLAAFHVEVGMQKAGMRQIIAKPLGFFDEHASGKMRKIVNDGAGTTHTFLAHQLPDLAGTLLSPLFLLALFFAVDWRMGIASLVPILLGFTTMVFMRSTKGTQFQKAYYDSLEEMSSESVEYVRGIPVVKTFGQSILSFKRFYESIIHYKDMVSAFTRLWQIPMSFYTIIMQSAAFFLIPVVLLLISRGENLSQVLADFIFYLLISPIFTTLFMRSMYFQQNFTIAEQALDRLDQLLAYPDMNYIAIASPAAISQELSFHNVSFSYPDSPVQTLSKISFTLKKGETIALVGPSGGGKTTIARLAARFWDPDEGEIRIGGMNIKDFSKQELMNHISFVFQNTKLFKVSLRDNILLGNPSASAAEIQSAITSSQAQELIDALPDGLDTLIGSKGTYLSGGQQQRIALARAIVKNAPIILLDEATAFADPENEHLIQKALKELCRDKTTLMIAHRLTSVQTADQILVIDHGEIVQSGTHQELLAQGGLYKTMWDSYQKSATWRLSSKIQIA